MKNHTTVYQGENAHLTNYPAGKVPTGGGLVPDPMTPPASGTSDNGRERTVNVNNTTGAEQAGAA
ncbi:hypothetical protein ACIRD8_36865 [Streptomyces sp. NPDC102451]|uniref:hypothetical protein n=1 Tax=Streptomyces sp. NPDC102451 TaxID=3366177 RepID=UPI003817CA08